MTALQTLQARVGTDVFTVREVYAEMVVTGTRYAEPTVLRTMQAMKAPPDRPPFVWLERAGREGFRLTLG